MVELPTIRIAGSGRFRISELGKGYISGSGKISPEEIKISGSGRLPGGIEVSKLRKSGSLKVEGDMVAGEMDCSGSTKIHGDLQTGYLKHSGSLIVEGFINGDYMRGSGSTRVEDNIKLKDRLIYSGSLETGGNIHTDNLMELSGSFYVSGKLTTKELDVSLNISRSRVETGIEAEHIDIKRGYKRGYGRREGELITPDIRGKDVFIENVTCDDVYGERVTIGEGCRIRGQVRYTKEIEVHRDAHLSNPPEKVDML